MSVFFFFVRSVQPAPVVFLKGIQLLSHSFPLRGDWRLFFPFRSPAPFLLIVEVEVFFTPSFQKGWGNFFSLALPPAPVFLSSRSYCLFYPVRPPVLAPHLSTSRSKALLPDPLAECPFLCAWRQSNRLWELRFFRDARGQRPRISTCRRESHFAPSPRRRGPPQPVG